MQGASVAMEAGMMKGPNVSEEAATSKAPKTRDVVERGKLTFLVCTSSTRTCLAVAAKMSICGLRFTRSVQQATHIDALFSLTSEVFHKN